MVREKKMKERKKTKKVQKEPRRKTRNQEEMYLNDEANIYLYINFSHFLALFTDFSLGFACVLS